MAITGPPPKPANQRRRHAAPSYGWLEVPNVPAPGRPMPKRPGGDRWPAGLAATWRAWSRMPHTVHWVESDWAYATESLLVAARFFERDGAAVAAELRLREAAMGTTWASRQSLRLRYVPVVEDSGEDASVSSLAHYRDL